MNHLSLFTGIGGLDLAAEWAGFKTVGQVEIDDYCQKVLQKHWPDVPKWRGIYQLTGEEVKEKCGSISLLSGGFPCQPFSCAGKRKGTEDERYLWGEMLRIICEVRPRWVVAENVRGLLSIDAGRTFGTVLSDLAENGYSVGWLCYGAGDVGAPHRRERVFIVANANNSRSGTSRDEINGNGQEENEGWAEQSFGGVGRQGEDVGNPKRTGQPMCIMGQGQVKHGRAGNGIREGQDRATESSMGGVPSRFPAGLHGNWPAGQWPTPATSDSWFGGCSKEVVLKSLENGTRAKSQLSAQVISTWPAGPGEQHEWEPPRIATGIKDRVARLKCLGNAVVPQQAYPIFKAIADMEG